MRKFYKMHGIGNDYIYFDCFEEPFPNPRKEAVRLSDRHFSIGGDGIVLICPSDVADAQMRMFNADGSEGMMCGNAIRCVAKYLYDVKGIQKKTITIETRSGIKTVVCDTRGRGGKANRFTVDMGPAILSPAKIPALFDGGTVVNHPLLLGEETYRVTLVSMGNPHCVLFTEDVEGLDLTTLGPRFERHPAFPERINTEFIEVLGPNCLKMRVWERGSGETLACGTGACAAAVASVLNGYCEKDTEISVLLRGGELRICYTDEAVYMTGPAAISFVGEVEL